MPRLWFGMSGANDLDAYTYLGIGSKNAWDIRASLVRQHDY